MDLRRWIGAITTIEDARHALDVCSLAFAVLSVLQAGIGVFVDFTDVLQAGVWMLLSVLLRVSQSRWVAFVLLLAACVSVANTVASRSDGITGSNLGLVVLTLLIAGRAAHAAFALHHAMTPDTALDALNSVASAERCPRCGVAGAEMAVLTRKWRCKTCGSWWANQVAAS
jgi:ABC-type methionine transport system permease subunit